MALLRPPPTKTAASTLAERIDQITAEIEALIQDRIALEAAECPGVPAVSLRQLFDARFGRCACKAYKRMQFEKLTPEERAAHDDAEQQKRAAQLSRELREA
jgi:hypothetical protein